MASDPRDRDQPDAAERADDEADWARRRADLDRRLGEHRTRSEVQASAERSRAGGMQGMAQGLKIASEFVAGVAVGALLGFGLDWLAGTSPFGLIVFLLLGFAAGVLNVIRGSRPQPAAASGARAEKPSAKPPE